jgi:AraC-like DNA-binding protein
MRRISEIPRTAGVSTRLAYARAKAAGLVLPPLLRGAGLTEGDIEDRNARLSVTNQIKFLNLAAQALHDDFLGFHLGECVELRELGLFYYALASSETLIEAFRRAPRYFSIVNEGVVLDCVEQRRLSIAAHYTGVSRHVDRHQAEFWAVSMLRMARQLTGVRLVPKRVRFVHVRRATSDLVRYFGRDVEFGGRVDEVALDPSAGDLPIVNADPYLNRLLLSYCEQAVAHRFRAPEPFRSKVENAIVPLLPHGGARANEIARRLGLSQRTFARRLASEGLTFSGVLSDLRRDLARRYLGEKSLPISQIAWLLGYQGVSAFSHAFRRWTDKTPRATASRSK